MHCPLVNQTTFHYLEKQYQSCKDKPFILLSGGIGVGKTMIAKMLAVKLADAELSELIPDNIEKSYAIAYLDTALLLGQIFMARYKELLENITFVSLHQGYSYDNLVYGLQVQTDNHALLLQKQEQIFLEVVKRAAEIPDQQFVLILDDINRTDIAAALGGLLNAFESHGETGSIRTDTTAYPIPKNLHVIATINPLIGRETLDIAWFRRFHVIDMLPDECFFDLSGINKAVKDNPRNQRLQDYALLVSYEHEIYRHIEMLVEHCFVDNFSPFQIRQQMLGHGMLMYYDPAKSLRENLLCVNEILAHQIAPLLEVYVESGKMKKCQDIAAMRTLWDKAANVLNCKKGASALNSEMEELNQNAADMIKDFSYPNALYFFLFRAANDALVFQGEDSSSHKLTLRLFWSEEENWFNENKFRTKINNEMNNPKQPYLWLHSSRNSYKYFYYDTQFLITGGSTITNSNKLFFNLKEEKFKKINNLTQAIECKFQWLQKIEGILFPEGEN